MGIIRKYENIVRYQLLSQKAAIGYDDVFKIIKTGTAAEVCPELSTDGTYNHFMQWEIGDYSGFIRVTRLDLTKFWKEMHNRTYGRALTIREPTVTCIHDVLKDFNEFTLLDLKPSDVVNKPLADGTYTEITIEVTPTCFWFTGSLTIPLQHKTVIVNGTVITKLPLSYKINDCDGDPTAATESNRVNGNATVYSTNFVKNTDELLSVVPPHFYLNFGGYTISAADATKVIEAINVETSYKFIHENRADSQQFNLYAAQVVYNGPVEGYNDLYVLKNGQIRPKHFGAVISKLNKPRQDLEFVLVIIPNPSYNNKLNFEPMFIHYGGPKPKQVSRPPVHHWPLRTDRNNRGTSPDKPKFLARGDFTTHTFSSTPAFVLNMGIRGGPSGKYITPIGTDLPVDGDWTIMFDMCNNYYKTNINSIFNLTSVEDNSTDRLQVYLKFTGAGDARVVFDNVSPRQTIIYPQNTFTWWPHWYTYTLVRRGSRLSLYKNGTLSQVYHDVKDKYTPFNSLMTYSAYCAPNIKEFRYFDYALDAQQVKDASVGKLDYNAPEVKAVELPKPVHYWTLDGHTDPVDIDDTPLQPIFSYISPIQLTDGKQSAINTISGGSKLGVSFDVSKDFTISFDIGYFSQSGNTGELGNLFSGNGKHTLSFKGTGVVLDASGGWDIGTATDPLCNGLPNQLLHYALVRRGDWLSVYINGLYLRSFRWLDKNTTYWDHFGGPSTLDRSIVLRNLKYYDVPLNEEHLLEDVIDRVAKRVDTRQVTIPRPIHDWQLQENGFNTGISKQPMMAPFKFVDLNTGKWATLKGGRTPQAFGPGVEMSRLGDWVLDFEILITGAPERNSLFVTHLNKPWGGYPSVLALYYNHPFEMGVDYDKYDENKCTINNNIPSRLILRCVSGKTSMYIDGVLASIYTNPTTDSFKGFRTTDGTDWFPWQMPEDATFIRNIRFWNRGLTQRQFDMLLIGGIPDNTMPPLHHWELNGNVKPTVGKTPLAADAFDWIEHGGKTWGYHKTNRVADLGVMLPTGKDSTFQFRMKLIGRPDSQWCGLFGNTGTSTVNDPARIKITSDTWTGVEKPKGYRPYCGLNAPIWVLSPQLSFEVGEEYVITVRKVHDRIHMLRNGVLYMIFEAEPNNGGITKVGASKEWMTSNVLIRDIKFWDAAIDVAREQ